MEENNLMNENNDKKKLGLIIGIVVFIILIVVFLVMVVFNKNEEESFETKQVTSYSNRMNEVMEKVKTMDDVEEAKSFVVSEIYDANELYGGNNSVDYISNQMLVTTMTDASTTIESLLSSLTSSLDKVVNDVNDGVDTLLNGNNKDILRTTLTMKSNTVCEDENIDNKYCVEKLSARIYIVDENSDKWAVLVHGNMMSGSLIYSALGNMYTEQGYNVIAPDLRGFGSSDGSVAMGYLESLDVYDWIKDLNANWKDRYGVTKAPSNIVVHGVSLGGATTLQLATNPDIAQSNRGPYTNNLTSLNVKGFVDDCGYTSMSGIITGMLSMGEMVDLTSILGSLNIDLEQFMSEFKKIADVQKIPGFEMFDISKLENMDFSQLYGSLEQFSGEFTKLQDELNKYINSNGNYEIPGMNQDTINNMLSESYNYFSNQDVKNKVQNMMQNYFPEDYKNMINNFNKEDFEDKINDAMNNINQEEVKDKIDGIMDGIDGIGQNTSNVVRLASTNSSEQVLEGLIAKVLMNLVGVGLTEENYVKYSNVFSTGRKFVSGSKVMVIHGTADTTVPHSNADTVEKNVNPGILVHKWDAENQPHAFIVIGAKKEEYKTLVSNYLKCIDDSTCTSVSR